MLDRFLLRSATFSAALTLALLALVAVASPAFADARTEGAAKALDGKAMQEDYLSTDFDKALEKLNQAASKCGADKCSSMLRAQIKRDLGVVQMAKSNREAAVAAFTEALRADPNVQLDPDTRTKEIDAAWAEAKKQASASGGGSAPSSGGAPPAGDFTMQPAGETLARTPLDLYGEYSGSDTLAKVVLKYKAFGMTEWKTLEMKAMGSGWGAEIPCVDIIEGSLAYYVQGFNASNDPVATSGDRNNPFHTAVKHAFNGEVPHFPGRDAPRQCADAGDCPPDFPGCKKPATEGENPDSSLKGEGLDCEEDSECKSGTCGKEKTCLGGEGSSSPTGHRRRIFWLGVDLAYDFVNLPSGNDVCALGDGTGGPFPGPPGAPVPQANNYYCTVGGADFPGTPTNNQAIAPGQSDKVQPGGFAPGNFRASISLDWAVRSNFLIGARFGYVFNGYNGSFATHVPIHAEVRATYLIGNKPSDRAGLSPYIMVAGGISQYSAEVGVTAISKASAASGVNCTQDPQKCTVYANAWNIGGPGFAAIGAGIRYAFTPAVALLFGPRFTLAFGNYNTLVVISPELALQYGF